ncbi:MAG: alpha-L-fucosidase [Atopobiaceae bacterium]|jgi:alpha-L-fucosidase|nr:alpha-L-fucosidase [Atopobiaceae bacterium]
MDREQEQLEQIRATATAGPYAPDWASLFSWQPPRWFVEARFGIFVHWGVYSVAAHANEWYPRNMYIQDKEECAWHRRTFGDQATFGYKDLVGRFHAEAFDPEAWADLFRRAGARYVVPVAEHHDGFQMYASDLSRWNAAEMGPHRDVLGELKEAIEREGMAFGTSSHRAEHWFFMGHGREFASDVAEPLRRGDLYWPAMPEADEQDLRSKPYPTEEFIDDWLLRTCELIDRYKPSLLYFDWWIQHEAFRPALKTMAAYYYNRAAGWGREVGICYKHDALAFGTGIVEMERGGFDAAQPFCWQTDTAIANNSWCYTDTLEYKSARQIICALVETVSKNGNLLLNVGPKGDGSIADEDRDILLAIGDWLAANGEAIYGSKPWHVSQEGPTRVGQGQFSDSVELPYTAQDIRFTVQGDSVYAFVMRWPQDGEVTVRSLADSPDQDLPLFHGLIRDVSVLGWEGRPCWSTDAEGLHVSAGGMAGDAPVVIGVRME